MSDTRNNLDEIQEAIGVRDEEVASRAKLSTQTLRRAKKGEVPADTIMEIEQALDTLRLERIDRLTKLRVKAIA